MYLQVSTEVKNLHRRYLHAGITARDKIKDLTPMALTLAQKYCHPGPRAGIQRVLDCGSG